MHFIFVLIALIALFLFYNYYWKRRNFPPGPAPLPLLGNLLPLKNKKRFEYQFVEWAKEYGPIYTYWLGETPIIAVNDAKLAHQMFVKDGDTYIDRGKKGNFQLMLGEKQAAGVIFTDGQVWQDQRRFALRFLRDFGLGKNQMQDRILDEVQTIIEDINKDIKSGTKEHDLYNHTDIAVGSIINSLIFGYRFTQDGNEKEFHRLKDLTIKMLMNFNSLIVLLGRFNEWIEDLTRQYMTHYFMPIRNLFDFIDDQIRRRVKTEDIDENMEPRDLVDAFLIEKAKQKRLDLPTADLYNFQQLRGLAFDLWLAGQETTSNTINWAVADLIKFPKVQEKIHEELDRVIGSDRIITVADRQNLNYINAFIMEVQRASNIVAQNVLRITAKDVEVNGFKIKKGSYCIAQISALHYDPKVFPNPDDIKPERFLNGNGQLIRNDEKLDAWLPFSLGKRVCLGEALARMELFLFIANLCNQYKFSAGTSEPILEKVGPGATSIIPYKCVVKRRFDV